MTLPLHPTVELEGRPQRKEPAPQKVEREEPGKVRDWQKVERGVKPGNVGGQRAQMICVK